MTYNPGMPPVPPPPGAYLGPPAQVIAQDVACRKCGYNLRGLTPSMRCPECGTAVGYSLQGDLLRFCDPNWVDTLRRGVAMIIGGVAVIFLGILVTIPLAFAVADTNPELIVILMAAAVVVGYVLMTVGWWFLTQPDPSGIGEDQYGTARKIIRVALIVGIAQSLLALVVAFASVDEGLMMGLSVVILLAAVVGVVGLFAELSYLKDIALRIPDQKLSDRAHFLMYALGITYAVTQVIGVVEELTGMKARGPGANQGFVCFKSIAGICLLVFGIMFLLMLDKLRRRFRESTDAARATWAAAPYGARGAQLA